MPRPCITGKSAYNYSQAQIDKVPRVKGLQEAGALADAQRVLRERGYLEAEIMPCPAGFYLRHASGFLDWAPIAGPGTLDEMTARARLWVREDPTRRYVTYRESD